MAFLDQLVRAEWNCHINFAELPFHPGAPVEPDVAVLHPSLALKLVEGLKHGLGADAVCSVRVCEVSCHIDLVRLNLLEQVDDDVDVLLCALPFLDASRLVERKVEEVGVGVVVQTE